jgi:probable lipoprotein (TIGR04455 family)
MRRAPLALLPSLVALLGTGCVVKSVYVKPDFSATDRLTLKRLSVHATAVPGTPSPTQAGALLARIARRYVHEHKDYIVVGDGALEGAERWRSRCAGKVQGVVRILATKIVEDARKLSLDFSADLLRCDTGATVWRVVIRDRHRKSDDDLRELASVYKREFGAIAESLAAPFFVAVKAAFESLPSPQLTDEETMEKISAGE